MLFRPRFTVQGVHQSWLPILEKKKPFIRGFFNELLLSTHLLHFILTSVRFACIIFMSFEQKKFFFPFFFLFGYAIISFFLSFVRSYPFLSLLFVSVENRSLPKKENFIVRHVFPLPPSPLLPSSRDLLPIVSGFLPTQFLKDRRSTL